ncbi:TetR/AcrR family transcriptional regulator [Roseovarius sp. SCSIO 43702]|nr:TetR/AcrR family transcriptional regulator [Roseovarius sp. SCSIO 43702]QYX58697.1 TetR/AcrR family transcriptional regulator [Roseovarius sp. SCSIO 43702]
MSADIKKGRKFDQVLEGARTIFLRDGFERASVDDIAREAGVSKATLYSYFPDKRLLFSEIARIECNRQAEAALKDFDPECKSVEDALREAAELVVRFFLSEFGLQMFRTCVTESQRFPELGERFYASGPGMLREKLGTILDAYVARGDLEIDDMDLAASQFGELCKSDLFVKCICGLQCACDDAAIDRVVTGVVEMFLARYGVKQSG